MMKVETTLFELEIGEGEFSVYEADRILDREQRAKLLFGLSERYGVPVFSRGREVLIPSGNSPEKNLSEQVDDYTVFLTYRGKRRDRPSSATEAGEFLRKLIRDLAHEIRNGSLLYRDEEAGIALVPEPVVDVYQGKKGMLLHIDIARSIVEIKTLGRLLEEGVLSAEDVCSYRYKPTGSSRSFECTDFIRELPKEAIQELMAKARTKKVKEYLSGMLESGIRGPFLLLDNRYYYPAHVVRRSLSVEDLEGNRWIFNKIRVSPERRREEVALLKKYVRRKLEPFGVIVRGNVKETERIDYLKECVDAEGNTFNVERSSYRVLMDGVPFLKKENLKALLVDTVGSVGEEALFSIIDFLERKGIALSVEKLSLRNGTEQSIKEEFYQLLREGLPLEAYDLGIILLKFSGDGSIFFSENLYEFFKKVFLDRGVPTQILLEKTLMTWDQNKLLNTLLGILGKTGNIPYRLARGLEDVDAFVGIDVGRSPVRDHRRSPNVASVVKVFLSNGEFLRYSVNVEPVGGEALEPRVIDRMVMRIGEILKRGARVVIHRDGRFQKGEVETILDRAKLYGLEVVALVEVIKSRNPRFLDSNCPKGTFLELDENSCVVSTYVPKTGTHMPPRLVRVYGDMDLRSVASHVLSLTLLNYGSLRFAKLPVTTYYPDRISYLALRGIKPPGAEGTLMYWL